MTRTIAAVTLMSLAMPTLTLDRPAYGESGSIGGWGGEVFGVPLDGDGIGYMCDADGDNEGLGDARDNCPTVANAGWEDSDGDGIGNASDQRVCFNAAAPLAELTLQDIAFGTRVRYLGFQANPEAAGRQQAIRVTVTDLPPPFESANGRTMWVGEPDREGEVQEFPPYYWVSTLQCNPHWTDWTQYEAVFVRSDSLVPGGLYDVQAIDESCSTTSEADYSEPLPIKLSRWGDVVGTCLPETSPQCIRAYGYTDCCTAPNGAADFDDISAVIDKFKNSMGAPRESRADVAPTLPNRILDFADISAVVDAFKGRPYPYTGPPVVDPCP